ncbi:MAG: RNA polymerase sigma factor [Bacteroidales bacterium]|jgi:RNA polymerase sigma-70 factor (ECF subfamily)|nr:RNA polymerase sigma factor [Bacteroidales bacterium]
MNENEDLKITIERCKQGDRISQKAIFEMYKDYMLALCQRYAKSNTEAEDMLMEGFLKVFQNIASFKELPTSDTRKPSFKSWVKKIIINNAINSFHYNKKHNTLETNLSIEEVVNIETDYMFSEEELIYAIRKLPNKLRVIFNMAVIDDLHQDEIANILKTSKDAVKMSLYRARILLKKHLLLMLNEKQLKQYGNR